MKRLSGSGLTMRFGWKAHQESGVPWVRQSGNAEINLRNFLKDHPDAGGLALAWRSEGETFHSVLMELRWNGYAGDYSICLYRENAEDTFIRELFSKDVASLIEKAEWTYYHRAAGYIELWRRDAENDDWRIDRTWPEAED